MLRDLAYAILRRVPRGRVVTYGDIARALGNPGLSRAVGGWLHTNPDPAHIPCHRVVNRLGEVSAQYAFGGAETQRARLEAEGIIFSPDGRIELKKYRLDPDDLR